MKKIFNNMWKLIKRHKLLTIICSLAIILIIVMSVALFSFFVGGNDKYGNRLDGIKEVKLTSKDKEEITYEEVTLDLDYVKELEIYSGSPVGVDKDKIASGIKIIMTNRLNIYKTPQNITH